MTDFELGDKEVLDYDMFVWLWVPGRANLEG